MTDVIDKTANLAFGFAMIGVGALGMAAAWSGRPDLAAVGCATAAFGAFLVAGADDARRPVETEDGDEDDDEDDDDDA